MDESLLTIVLALPYDARLEALRRAGAESLKNAKIAATLDDWERGDWQERFFCVHACAGSGEAARLHRLTFDALLYSSGGMPRFFFHPVSGSALSFRGRRWTKDD